MPSFDIPPSSQMTSFIYKITAKMFKIESNQGKRITDLGPLHLEHFSIYMNIVPIHSVFWPWIQAKLGTLQYLMVGPSPPQWALM